MLIVLEFSVLLCFFKFCCGRLYWLRGACCLGWLGCVFGFWCWLHGLVVLLCAWWFVLVIVAWVVCCLCVCWYYVGCCVVVCSLVSLFARFIVISGWFVWC